jgi:hypothetical protein
MNIQGIRLFIYPIRDMTQAKTLYGKFSGVKPYMDEAYYVGFRVGNQEIGLDPNSHKQGMTGHVDYWQVDDIKQTLQLLLDAGTQAPGGQRCWRGQTDCNHKGCQQ